MYQISDEILDEIHDLTEGKATGFIHNVSPMKQNNHFDFQLQMKSKTVRAVCFSPGKRKHIENCSKVNTPVKIKKFRLETKSNSEDIVIDEKAEIEELDKDKISFKKKEIPTHLTIAQIPSICVGQLITIKAKVAHLQPIREVKNGGLKLVEASLIDKSDNIKMIIWQDHIHEVEAGKTYIFKNIRIKKDSVSKEIYVNTAKADTCIILTDDFTEQLAMPLQDFTTRSLKGEILSVDKITVYHACYKCHKKVDFSGQNYIECGNCKVSQKPKACPKQCVVYVTFLCDNEEKVPLTIFTDVVLLLCKQLKVSLDNITEQYLKSTLFSLPDDIQVTFNRKTKVVSNILLK